MNSLNAVAPEIALEATTGLSTVFSRLSLLTAVVASQAYLIHASFFAHALIPVEVYVVDPKTHLHLPAGEIGNIEAIFHWDGVIPTILISVLVFALGWIAAWGTAKLLTNWKRPVLSSRSLGFQISLAIVASDNEIVTNGGIE